MESAKDILKRLGYIENHFGLDIKSKGCSRHKTDNSLESSSIVSTKTTAMESVGKMSEIVNNKNTANYKKNQNSTSIENASFTNNLIPK